MWIFLIELKISKIKTKVSQKGRNLDLRPQHQLPELPNCLPPYGFGFSRPHSCASQSLIMNISIYASI